ncbi:hypothetical protein OL548_26495 [Lysinibacillus sp. MHQ-1]|nr:hypothetical protein OL548_26495 [Lysinibacillus sp. MHQ-1]
MRYVYVIPAVFSSLLLGLFVTITLEWIALDLPLQLSSFKKAFDSIHSCGGLSFTVLVRNS